MPRKRPRNPLKRKQVEFDADPSANINLLSKRKKKQRKQPANEDDTPKAFARMMKWQEQRQAKQNNREDDTTSTTKKKKAKESSDANPAAELKIMPGESMGEFSRRVNEALPLVKARSGSPSRADKKRMRQKEKAERLKRERRRAAGLPSDEETDEEEETTAKRGRKRSPSPDPWASLESRKQTPKFGEVADRPPELTVPKKLLNNVPKSAGSMAKRHMLEQERGRFIEAYRKLMEEKAKSGDS